jgi:hypothetical protein
LIGLQRPQFNLEILKIDWLDNYFRSIYKRAESKDIYSHNRQPKMISSIPEFGMVGYYTNSIDLTIFGFNLHVSDAALWVLFAIVLGFIGVGTLTVVCATICACVGCPFLIPTIPIVAATATTFALSCSIL